MDVAFAYVGTTGVLEAAGFTRIAETTAHSARKTGWLMRLDLAKWTARRIQAEALAILDESLAAAGHEQLGRGSRAAHLDGRSRGRGGRAGSRHASD